MKRPSTAERDQRNIAWIETTLGGTHPNRPFHVGIGYANDTSGGFLNAEVKCLPDFFRDGLACGFAIDQHLTAYEPIWMQPPKNDVGIGDRRLSAATAISSRTRVGSSTLGADMKPPPVIEPCNAARTSADGVYLDHRQFHRVLGDGTLRGHTGLALVDQ